MDENLESVAVSWMIDGRVNGPVPVPDAITMLSDVAESRAGLKPIQLTYDHPENGIMVFTFSDATSALSDVEQLMGAEVWREEVWHV